MPIPSKKDEMETAMTLLNMTEISKKGKKVCRDGSQNLQNPETSNCSPIGTRSSKRKRVSSSEIKEVNSKEKAKRKRQCLSSKKWRGKRTPEQIEKDRKNSRLRQRKLRAKRSLEQIEEDKRKSKEYYKDNREDILERRRAKRRKQRTKS